MLTIGEFSRICRVSTKTLRYYETMGLLQPWLVNPATGYRFYTADQFGTMRLINRLKAYNFTLEEIKLLVVTFNGERSSLSAAGKKAGTSASENAPESTAAAAGRGH